MQICRMKHLSQAHLSTLRRNLPPHPCNPLPHSRSHLRNPHPIHRLLPLLLQMLLQMQLLLLQQLHLHQHLQLYQHLLLHQQLLLQLHLHLHLSRHTASNRCLCYLTLAWVIGRQHT